MTAPLQFETAIPGAHDELPPLSAVDARLDAGDATRAVNRYAVTVSHDLLPIHNDHRRKEAQRQLREAAIRAMEEVHAIETLADIHTEVQDGE